MYIESAAIEAKNNKILTIKKWMWKSMKMLFFIQQMVEINYSRPSDGKTKTICQITSYECKVVSLKNYKDWLTTTFK